MEGHPQGGSHQPGRRQKKLIGPAPLGSSGPARKLPDVFGITGLYEYLDFFRTFGQDPTTFHERVDDWWHVHLAEYAAVQSQLAARRL